MCTILDVNRAHEVLRPSLSELGDPLKRWVEKGHGRLILGGTLSQELGKDSNVRRWITELNRIGRVVSLTLDGRNAVKIETDALKNSGTCKSNDEHVIALAMVTGARLLCTDDRDLQDDFKNRELIDHPRGRIYPLGSSKGDKRKFLNQFGGCTRAS